MMAPFFLQATKTSTQDTIIWQEPRSHCFLQWNSRVQDATGLNVYSAAELPGLSWPWLT
jgi:hypothetical protein